MADDTDAHHESMDAHAFAAACEAVAGIHPDQVRRIVDAYADAAHLRIREIHEDHPLTAEEAIDAFRPRDVEFDR